MRPARGRRLPDEPAARDAERASPSRPPEAALGILALQRSAGNRAVARLLEREQTLHAPASWLDNETASGADRATLRHLYTTRPADLTGGLAASLPLPGLGAIMETEPGDVRNQLLFDMKKPVGKGEGRVEQQFVAHAKRVLASHTDLMSLGPGIDPNAPPQARKIMRPLDLMPGENDLEGISDQELKVKWCALIALFKSEGKEAIRAFLKDKVDKEGWKPGRLPGAADPDIDYWRAMHAYFYTFKRVEYDDTSSKMTIMRPFGYRLKFVGPTSFDQLWRAQLQAGRYIVDIARPGHTMMTRVQDDFTAPLPANKQLSDVFEFFNEGSNYSHPIHVTLAAQVINIWEK
jgi:hypothetical protein